MEMEEIFDKLQAVADRYDELNELISDPEVIADTARFMKLSKEEGSLRKASKERCFIAGLYHWIFVSFSLGNKLIHVI